MSFRLLHQSETRRPRADIHMFPGQRVPLMKGRRKAVAAMSALLSIAVLSAFVVAEKTEIRVRLINALTGKPYAGRDHQIFGTNTRSGLPDGDILFHLQTKSGPDGVAHFLIGAPLPYRLLFYSAQANGCGPPGFNSFVTAEVMRTGVVVPNTCAGKHQKYDCRKVTAQPGEIVIFAVEPRGP